MGQRVLKAESGSIACVLRAAAVLCLSAMLLALGGCGGVQFEGKIFDYAGLSGERKQEDVQMAERPPLVIPPDTNHLPPPGSGPATPTAWPTNPEVAQREAETQQAAAEKERRNSNDPLNPYAGKPTLLDKLLGRDKTEQTAAVADVPEPDPSGALPPVNGGQAATPKRNAYKPPTDAPTPGPNEPEEEEEPKASTYESVNDGSYRGM